MRRTSPTGFGIVIVPSPVDEGDREDPVPQDHHPDREGPQQVDEAVARGRRGGDEAVEVERLGHAARIGPATLVRIRGPAPTGGWGGPQRWTESVAHGTITSVRWPAPPGNVWLDPRVEIRTSPIEGRGLLRRRAHRTRRGGGAGRWPHRRHRGARSADRSHRGRPRRCRTSTRSPSTTTSTSSCRRGHPRHFGNHSCDPTLWFGGPYELVARRDLEPGDELTLDYGTISGAPGFTMPCRCGSELCRGVVTSEDWRRPELRARYRGRWVPALDAP